MSQKGTGALANRVRKTASCAVGDASTHPQRGRAPKLNVDVSDFTTGYDGVKPELKPPPQNNTVIHMTVRSHDRSVYLLPLDTREQANRLFVDGPSHT